MAWSFAALVVLVGGVALVAGLCTTDLTPAEAVARYGLAVSAHFVRPEASERIAWTAGLLTALAGAILLGRGSVFPLMLRVGATRAGHGGAIGIALVAVLLSVGLVLWQGKLVPRPAVLCLVVGAAAAVAARRRAFATWALFPVWGLAVLGLALRVAHAPLGLRDLTPEKWAIHNHLSAFASVVISVVHGRTLGVDLQGLYGGYPHFLEPILRTSVDPLATLLLLMPLLSALAMGLVAYTASRSATDRWVGACATLALAWGQVAYILRNGEVDDLDPYFQGVPLRLLAPAAFLATLLAEARAPSSRRRLFLHALVVLALLWNPDSGAAVAVAWVGYLLWSFGPRPRELLREVGAGVAVAALIALLVGTGSWLRCGKLPDVRALLSLGEVFAIGGVSMEPLPWAHPWIVAVLAPLALIAAAARRRSRGEPDAAFGVALALLALGLLQYFAGRSRTVVLVSVLWPSVWAGALAVHWLAPRARWVLVGVAVAWSVALAWAVPLDAKAIWERPRTQPGQWEDLAEWVTRRHPADTPAVVVSPNAYVVHALTGLPSPLSAPSIADAVTRAQWDDWRALVQSGAPVVFVDKAAATGPPWNQSPEWKALIEDVARLYTPVDSRWFLVAGLRNDLVPAHQVGSGSSSGATEPRPERP